MISDEDLQDIALIDDWYNGVHLGDMAKELLALRKARKGWKLVPAEATEEMISAGDAWCDGLTYLSSAYEAMLAAAPSPHE